MGTENSKTSQPHKFVVNLTQRLELKRSINMLLFKILYLLQVEKYKTIVQKQ